MKFSWRRAIAQPWLLIAGGVTTAAAVKPLAFKPLIERSQVDDKSLQQQQDRITERHRQHQASFIETFCRESSLVPSSVVQCFQIDDPRYDQGIGPRFAPVTVKGTTSLDKRKVITIDYDDFTPLLKRPSRPPQPQPKQTTEETTLQCDQHIYFWGNRENLPYGNVGSTDNEDEGLNSNRSDMPKKFSRGSVRPYLEDVGPQLDGHFKAHASRWFDAHQYKWKSIELGSHFGAALTEDGEVYIWGSFIPPLVMGPFPILLTPTTETPTPTLTLILHQSVARIPTEFRCPTYPEQLAIDEAEQNRVFVGPVNVKLDFKVKEVKAAINKLFFLSTKGQVFCLDNLIEYLHWVAFDQYVAPSPPIANPYNTVHNAILDMKTSQRRLRRKKKPSLTSTLPQEFHDSSSEEQSDSEASHSVLLSLDELSERIPSQVLIDPSGEIFVPKNYTIDGSTKLDGAVDENSDNSDNSQSSVSENPYPDFKVEWAQRPSLYLLRQLPQPGYLFGKGVKQIEAGFDHLGCLTESGELYCLGDNSYGQCGVDPAQNDRHVVGIAKVEHPSQEYPKPTIVSLSCGAHHTTFQDDQGVVYSFGDDSRLQLGHGDTRQDLGFDLDPTSVISLEWNDSKRQKVAMNRHGQSSPVQSVVQYGILEKHQTWKPTPVMRPVQLSKNAFGPPDMVQCSALTTCMRYTTTPSWIPDLRTTELHCTGDNVWGQCGSNEQPAQQPFRTVRLPRQFECLRMSCGLRHCLAFVSSGDLYGWGDNRYGQVGVASKRYRVTKEPKKLLKPKIIHVERPTATQKLLGAALQHQGKPVYKLVPIEADELRKNRGELVDFIDQDAAEKMKQDKDRKKNKPEKEQRPLMTPSNLNSNQISDQINNSAKPLFRLSPDYPGDIVHISCGFDSTAIIRNVNPNKVAVKQTS